MNRIRLLPVLVFGLVSLLTIKILSFVLEDPAGRGGAFSQESPGSRFAHVIERARERASEEEILTGSVPEKKEPGKEADAKAGEAEAAKKVAEADVPKPKIKSEPEGVRIPPPNSSSPDRPLGQSTAERDLLEKLKDRREAIDAKDRDLELRDSLLRASERKLDEKIGQLRSLENQGEGGNKADTKTRFQPLVTMYEGMKPKDAARVFDRLDLRVLMDLIAHMNPRKMSDILAAMDPAAAEKLTVALARQAGAAQTAESSPANADTELQRLPINPGAKK